MSEECLLGGAMSDLGGSMSELCVLSLSDRHLRTEEQSPYLTM